MVDEALVLERVYNFRDLGGLPVAGGGAVRRGRLFRSATPQQLTEGDLELFRSRIGLRRVLDLRFPKESASEGHGLLEGTEVEIHKLPFRVPRPADASAAVPKQTADVLGPFYLSMIELSTEPIANAVRILADDGLPALFHCAAGKDRTGILAALVLSTIGVPDEAVVADYERTNEAGHQIHEQLLTMDFYARDYGLRQPTTKMVDAGVMESFLAGVHERYGSAGEYLASAGITNDEIERLRDALVEG